MLTIKGMCCKKTNNCFRQKCVKAQSHLRFPANEKMCEISRKVSFILANFFAKMNFSEFFFGKKNSKISDNFAKEKVQKFRYYLFREKFRSHYLFL